MTPRPLVCVAVAALVLLTPRAAINQELGTLRITVALADAEQKLTPVARYTLLISDNPASGPPRRVLTASDGSFEVRLPPGSYIVESDRPYSFAGKGYQWTQLVEVVGGRTATLELTAANAEVGAAALEAPAIPGAPRAGAPSLILDQWQGSVIELWTPTAHATGFVVGTDGLVVTNQRVVGAATSIEAQISADVKVTARVLTADSVRDITVLWVDKATPASVRPVPLACGQPGKPVAKGVEIVAVEAPLAQPKDTSWGTVESVVTHAIISDITLDEGSEGSPVFTMDGALVGMASVLDDPDRIDFRVVPIADVCEAVASAEKSMKDGPPPSAARLPMEPAKPYPVDTLDDAVARRAGNLNPYQIATSDFDIVFLTPVLSYAAQQRVKQWRQPPPEPIGGRGGRGGTTMTVGRPPMDFGNWSRYVETMPPVLMIRVTPKLVEGFWAKVARGAASTQGVSLPPLKRFKSGFARLRAFCGDTELTPIHPLKLEYRVSKNESIYEGLYVFDPGAVTPECSSVKLMVYSEKEPEKPITQMVEARVITQIWQDFETYRAAK